MDNRNLLETIAIAAVGLVILVAVLAAGYMLVSSLFGSPQATPTPTPTPAPQNATPTPYAVIPSGPIVTNPNPSATAHPVIPTPVQPIIKSSQLVSYGTDKDDYNRGDTATIYMIIKNTGTVPIDDAKLHVSVSMYGIPVDTRDQTLSDLNIQAGETKKVEYSVVIPAQYNGMSTAGRYNFNIDVFVWDDKIGSFSKQVTVH